MRHLIERALALRDQSSQVGWVDFKGSGADVNFRQAARAEIFALPALAQNVA